MSNYQNVFQRHEIKYLLSAVQYRQIKEEIQDHVEDDLYAHSSICNLYFDTTDYRLIRRSIERPVYKEKLRVRSYGVAEPGSSVFVELKKKYDSMVYKRRISFSETQAMEYLCGHGTAPDTQIAREINYFLSYYGDLFPTVFLSYERDAFHGIEDPNLRITFDKNILWRDYDLSLCNGIYGAPIMENEQVLLEIKTAGAIPLWMTSLLSKHHIYKTSFSKYGTVYQTICTQNPTGGIRYA